MLIVPFYDSFSRERFGYATSINYITNFDRSKTGVKGRLRLLLELRDIMLVETYTTTTVQIYHIPPFANRRNFDEQLN